MPPPHQPLSLKTTWESYVLFRNRLQNIGPNKTILLVIGALLLVIAIWSTVLVVNYRNNLGLIAFSIDMIPSDSSVKIDKKRVKPKTVHLSPGEHTISIEKDGFKSVHKKIYVSASNNWFFSILQPESEKAKKWYKNNVSVTKMKNAQSDLIESTYNNTVSQNPIIDYLPKTDTYGPYKIDYGFDEDLDRLYLIISLSTPDGRREAIDWIRSLGVDPTSLDIRYADGDVDGFEPPRPIYSDSL